MTMRAEACTLHPKLRHCQAIRPLPLRDVSSLGGPLVLQAMIFVNNLGDQTCNEESLIEEPAGDEGGEGTSTIPD